MTIDQLTEAGQEAYVPILQKLLHHPDARIRRHTVEVIAVLDGPQVAALLRQGADDPEETVRETARKALAALTGEAH